MSTGINKMAGGARIPGPRSLTAATGCFDNDGNLDLLIVNGHPDDQIELTKPSIKYLGTMLLFHNNGKVLKDVTADAGPVFRQPLAARGLAIGDFDNNGSVDALVSINNGQPLLLRNNSSDGNR